MELIIKRVVFCIVLLLDVILLACIISYIISFFKIDVSKYKIISDDLPKEFDGFKILQLSDLHNKRFGKNNKDLVKKINAENPNIVVMTGDMISSNSSNINAFIELVESLQDKYPMYYIVGNHEQRLSNQKQLLLLKRLEDLGVKVLNNENVSIQKYGKHINLYGLNQPLSYYKNYFKNTGTSNYELQDISLVFPILNDTDFNILLAHNPLYFDTYAKWGADLIFSGHVHGGIVNIPFVGGVLSPERAFFPKYSGGKYSIDDSEMIVSRGLGFSTLNLRIFNNPEICIAELKSKK